jgi:hypothetical protein
MEIYTAQGKKLNDTVMSVLENNVGVHHHVYQDNFYNRKPGGKSPKTQHTSMWHNEA